MSQLPLFERFFQGINDEHKEGVKDYFLALGELPEACNKKEYVDIFSNNVALIFDEYPPEVIVKSLENELGTNHLSAFIYRMGQGRWHQQAMALFNVQNHLK
ncbi:hypothetical protein ACVRZR_06640 [Streptococcus entericus]|uniref:hypothetical protein n=1 Tax=Streptococcus entericus TaxID=155680 RepID=UPI0003713577|nr:hypothetical protein [Streptococcus entericus]